MTIEMAIEKAAVIGAGLMGGGIAAHIANAGHDVVLLDIVPAGGGNRNALAEGAVARMLKTEPAPFMAKADARRIATGNIEDHLHLLGDADWIVEAVIERVDAKQAIYRKIDSVRKEGAIVSSNTSTIPSAVLLDGMPDGFARDFLITHFFNPPRYMRLLEVVAGPQTRADAVAAVCDFADRKLGKGVVPCNDTPGFIANRIGTYWLVAAVRAALEGGVTVEEADAVLGRPVGVPKTGVFGLIDLVGLDLMPLVGRSLRDALPQSDPFHTVYDEPPFIAAMIESGYTGRKGKGGFYRLKPDSEKKEKEVLDLQSGEYGPARRPRLESIEQAGRSLRALFEHPDKTGAFAWRVMSGTLAYAAGLVPEIAGDVEAVDRAMRLGYAWKRGPFELIDEVGAGWFADKLAAEGRAVPPLLRAAADGGGFYRRADDGSARHLAAGGRYTPLVRPKGVLLLSDIKRGAKPLARNGSASLWDIGDGVACLEFHSKMNALDTDIMALVARSVEIVGGGMTALVIYNEGSNFSVGMNLGLALFVVNVGAWPMLEESVAQGQAAFKALKFGALPRGRRARRHGARRRLRDPAALRRGAGPCRELYRPGRGRRRAGARMGRLQGDDAARARRRSARLRRRDAGDLQGVRDHRHGQGLAFGEGGAGTGVPARGRRHHGQPRPAAGGCQGQGPGAGGGLHGARAGDGQAAGQDRARRAQDGGEGARQDPQGDAPRPGGGRASRQRADGWRDRHDPRGPGGPPLRTRTRGAARADPHARHHRPHGAHAGDRQAAQELA